MMTIVAVDDEPLALQLITRYIEETPELSLLRMFRNPLEAAVFLKENSVDIVMLDIQMPELNGIEFARQMPPGPKVIFTTAYKKYAIEGFKLEVVDYLVKPFSYQDFLKAIRRAEKIISLEKKSYENIESNNEFLYLKSNYKIKRLKFNDIQYIEGFNDSVRIYAVSSPEPIQSQTTLKVLEAKLPAGRFMRIHRSFIVNLQMVDTIDRGRIVFGKVYIPVGDQYKEKFEDYLRKNFL
ncbi:MAG: LytTR family DNA-binding domain-containing protein [Bacteroidia bacterium]|nr:LytTR family DNA-binding domain-containing protein [Bacteroidia bacterium]